ncbi:MAG: hydrolase [Myxococcales bacterium]|nr:hydrolase [Myxococcales bacterium]
MHFIRRGTGRPLLLIHGLGGSWRSWETILDTLSAQREVIAVDLPGFGETPPRDGEVSIRTLADDVTDFLTAHKLGRIDGVGSSMGARLVIELARRGGVLGSVVALAPGGFWRGWERHAFHRSIAASIRVLRALRHSLPRLAHSRVGRTLLLAQFSAHPWQLSPRIVRDELLAYVSAPSFDPLLESLATGETQKGAPAGSLDRPLVIGWGRKDRVCFPWQAKRALAAFPDAQLHWFDSCGHYPHWDAPAETTQLILDPMLAEDSVMSELFDEIGFGGPRLA